MDANGHLYLADPDDIPEVDKARAAEWAQQQEAAMYAELAELRKLL